MLERPLVRLPHGGKPEDDRWMLDRWTPVTAHTVVTVYREVKDREGRVVERVYRSSCSCGWRSIEFHKPILDVCPIYGALAERAHRLKKDGERIEWKVL